MKRKASTKKTKEEVEYEKDLSKCKEKKAELKRLLSVLDEGHQ